MTLGFLGPAHSFSERAALALANGRALVPFPDIAALFAALAHGQVDGIVVPLENSEVGAVPATLAELVALPAPLAVLGDLGLPIRFALYRRVDDETPLTRVVAHAMSLAQCAPWIAARGVGQRAVGSNGTAFAQVQNNSAAGEGALAPLGIEDAGMIAVEQNLQGARAFETRFLLLAPDAEPGSLHRALVSISGLSELDHWPGNARALTPANNDPPPAVYELTPAAPTAPDRLPGRPLLLWRASA